MGKFKDCSTRSTIGHILFQIRACTKELKYHQWRARYYYNRQTTHSWLSKAHKQIYNIHEIENYIKNIKNYIKELNTRLNVVMMGNREFWGKDHTHTHEYL